MNKPPHARIKPDAVYALTDKGNHELKAPGTKLSAEELEILVLVDGKSTVAEVAQRARSMGAGALLEMLDKLLHERLITTATEPTSDGLESGFFSIAVPAGFFSQPTPQAQSEAEQGVSTLKQKGFLVRIARARPEKREVKDGQRFTILLVDDDPDIVKLLRTYLKFEDFDTRVAANRDEIMGAFRQQPLPDLVLLDVGLPGVNGFDILAKMKLHPVLKSLPVIMLTAEATREAVLKGLIGGADGYVTKPFEPDAVTAAVRAVLGVDAKADDL